jgi:hypothetical protein
MEVAGILTGKEREIWDSMIWPWIREKDDTMLKRMTRPTS